MRIGIASILQETNTFSIKATEMGDFTVAVGPDIFDLVSGTNSELAGAIGTLRGAGADISPIAYAWAMPSGRVTAQAYQELSALFGERIANSPPLDALVLSLHGSMAAEGVDDADGALLEIARESVGRSVPIAVSLDLHANVTGKMVRLADTISAYHTDPHVDMALAGSRAAERAWSMAAGSRLSTGFAKRPLIVPAETMNTDTGPLARVRRDALAAAPNGLAELCLCPVQPWLDVPELGFSVVVSTTGGQDEADRFARRVADEVWGLRDEFVIDRLFEPEAAIEEARRSAARPFLMAESADAPTAGAVGDSPAMVEAFQTSGRGLVAYIPVVDPGSVARCHQAGKGSEVDLDVGAAIDGRWRQPVRIHGVVSRNGAGGYRLEGASFTGMEVSMGRFATVVTGDIRLLLSERPAWTSDPATFRFAGLPPEEADVIVVKSCSDFRPNYPDSQAEAVILDVAGTATPRLERLRFTNIERPPYPLDPWDELNQEGDS